MAETNSWIKVFRRAIKVSIGTGWTVQPDRGNIRVLYGKKASGFLSINLPYKWQEDQWVKEKGDGIVFDYDLVKINDHKSHSFFTVSSLEKFESI